MHIIRTLKGIYDEPEVAPAPARAPAPAPAPTPAPEVQERPEWVIWLATLLFIVGLISLLLLFLYNRRKEA